MLGFAVKAGKVIYGSDSLEDSRKTYYVICMCGSASDNAKKRISRLSEKKHIPVIVSEKELQYAVGRLNCKVIGVTDKQMAQAMLNNLSDNYHLNYSEVK